MRLEANEKAYLIGLLHLICLPSSGMSMFAINFLNCHHLVASHTEFQWLESTFPIVFLMTARSSNFKIRKFGDGKIKIIFKKKKIIFCFCIVKQLHVSLSFWVINSQDLCVSNVRYELKKGSNSTCLLILFIMKWLQFPHTSNQSI